MTFRCPSDAQARALRQIARQDAGVIWWPSGKSVYGRFYASVYVEVEDREADTSGYRRLAEYASDQIRAATLEACVRYGWLRTEERVFASGVPLRGVYHGGTESDVVRDLILTDDGRLALGLWAQRKLLTPPREPEPLLGADREVVELASRAKAHGFALLPVTKDAKRHARRLARTPYAERGWGAGASTRSLQATATGEVAVLPDRADVP